MAAQKRHRSDPPADRSESLEQWLDRDERARRPVDASSPARRRSSDDIPEPRETWPGELLDVPAAVVCILCGSADCPGCEQDQSRSGIVSIVAWERPAISRDRSRVDGATGASLFARLWSTARSATRDAEGFFELLPDGPLLPALRFAALCELFAASSMLLVFGAIAAAVAPEWVKHVALDPSSRNLALRVIVFGLPTFAGLLVVAHAVHGLSIDIGATRQGARGARSRALRFGLYACGWDLVVGPIGAVVVALKEGAHAALRLHELMSGLPTRSTKAFLRGCYRLEGDAAERALGTSYAGAVVATLAFVGVLLVALVVAVLA